MRIFGLTICLAAGALMLVGESAEGQLLRRNRCDGQCGGQGVHGGLHGGLHANMQANEREIYNGMSAEGMTTTNDIGRVFIGRSMILGAHNHFSPNPVYTYSNNGIRAGLTHQWNQQEALSRPWHGGYQYWRWAEPTALVLPPTASYQTSYGWGVGQVRSYPVHHQFGNLTAGTMIGGGEGGDAEQFPRTPYWPSHTDQMGVYGVRAPW